MFVVLFFGLLKVLNKTKFLMMKKISYTTVIFFNIFFHGQRRALQLAYF